MLLVDEQQNPLGEEGDLTRNNTYLELPLLLKYSLDSMKANPYFMLGGTYSTFLYSNHKFLVPNARGRTRLEKDFGATVAMGMEFPVKRNFWLLELRYTKGLINIFPSGSIDFTFLNDKGYNSYLSLTTGLRF